MLFCIAVACRDKGVHPRSTWAFREKKMSLIRKITLGLIGTSFMFGADAAGFAPIGAGMVVIGAGIGIGMFASAAAHATARQPEAAGDIRTTALIMSALIEGVALFCAVTCFLLSGNVGG